MDELLVADEENTFLQIARNLFNQSRTDDESAPISKLAGVAWDMASIDSGNQCLEREQLSVEDLESLIGTVVEFIHDEEYGLPAFYRLINDQQ